MTVPQFGTWEAYFYPPPHNGTLRNLFDERDPDVPKPKYTYEAYFETLNGQRLGSGEGSVSAQKVASGYKLRGTNRISNYICNSDKLIADLARCNRDGCTTIGRVAVSVKQYVFGGSSTRWNHTVTTEYIHGPRYSAEFTYLCARNIKSDPDKYCDDYSDGADGFDAAVVAARPGSYENENATINANFGRDVGKKKYGMINAIVRWDDYNVAARGDDGEIGFKYRTWDTKRFTSTDAHLESATGAGG